MQMMHKTHSGTMPAPSASAASNSLRRYLHGKGKAPYALITGATGGMGEEWAYGLAAHGFNVIIQGRNRAKLETVRQTIESRKAPTSSSSASQQRSRKRAMSGGKASATSAASAASRTPKRRKSVKKEKDQELQAAAAADATSSATSSTTNTVCAVPNYVEVELLVCEATPWPNAGLYDGLEEILSRKDVRLTVVINNLGVQSEGYPRLEDLSRQEVADIVIANSLFPAEITRSTLPSLKKHQPSLLVTVTSIGAWTPTPYLSPYMGTKGFDVAFSHSLRSEMLCEGHQVDVVCMVPGQVQSGMCLEPESLMVPTSRDWVRSAIFSLRPGGTLGALLPYSWFAAPAGTPTKKLTSSSASSSSPSPAAASYWTRPKGVITPWWPHYAGMLVAQYGPSWLLDSVAVNTVRGLKRKHEETAK